MSEPLKVTTSDYGDEYWYGGSNGQTVEVGETPTRWLAGCGKDEPGTWARLQREAAIISHALAPCDTVERQMALAVLQGDGAAALALADALCLARHDEAAARLYAAAPETPRSRPAPPLRRRPGWSCGPRRTP